MSAKKFKFVSPGVFLSEIDNSQLPKIPGGIGPMIIGRTRRGPAMKPVKVNSFQEFVEVFGEPIPGNEGEDPWRDGNGLLATAYAPYAAQAYLRADINSPVTVIRLLGVAGDDAGDSANAHPGWKAQTTFGIFAAPGFDHTSAQHVTASLVGIVYSDDPLIGVGVGGAAHGDSTTTLSSLTNKASGSLTVQAVDTRSHVFNIGISSSANQLQKDVSFRKGSKYIRDVLNTSPVATNGNISRPPSGSLAERYWIGETFEETYEEVARKSTTDHPPIVFTARLAPLMGDFQSLTHGLSPATSGWVVPQHVGTPSTYDPLQLEKLFRFHTIQEGEQGLNLYVCIENIKIAETGDPNPFGRFDVVVKQERSGRVYTVDSFENLNLNPNSDNFIARRIGDQYFEWDPAQKRNKVYGNYPSRSSYIRVEMGGDVGEKGPDNPKSVPFGYLGPIKHKDQVLTQNASDITTNGNDKWSVSKVKIPGTTSKKVVLEWPTAPHVVSGSLGIDLSAKYVMGHTPYNKEGSDAKVNFSDVNRGMKDYLRKFAEYGGAAGNQETGIATGDTSYAYTFSLDEVVITGSKKLTADLTTFNPTAVDFVAGSHLPALGATATLTININRASMTSDSQFDITDAEGITKSFIFKTDVNTVDGSTNPGGRFIVGVAAEQAGLNDADESNRQTAANTVATKIATVIGTTPVQNAIKITATATNNVVTVTQKITGITGNNVGGQGNFTETNDSAAKLTIVNFSGGRTSPGTSYTARSDGGGAIELLRVVDSFAMPMAGGFDGVNVTEADPFNMRVIGTDSTTRNSYAHASVDRAIELSRDPEALEMNLAAMPGISNTALTTKLVQVCEARADALAVIDLPDVYHPPAQKYCSSFKDRLPAAGRPEKSAKNLIARQINSSYGATYYPWVKIRDTISARDVWVPPSVVALGVMGYTEQRDEVWFAPAGFNRGGLNEGNAGVPVLQVTEQLLSSQRDRLYEANINPIASFVSEGLVVFGQKTLQMTPSALDRINVRRLLIFVKKEISRIANGLLFDQNVPATWNRFTGQVVPFLEGVKTRLGLTDFKVVLDKTTTTADLIDRNIMYAKIFLKPARAIEFIAVDFVITRTGASFDD